MRLSREGKDPRRIAAALATLALAAGALAGCGSAGDAESREAPPASEYPAPNGRTLDALAAGMGEADLVASPAGLVFDAGRNRYAFAVFTLGKEPVEDAEVALYVARGADGEAKGPLPARVESLRTPPAYRAATTVNDPTAATVTYIVPSVNFTAAGEWRLLAVFRGEDGFEATRMRSADVGRYQRVPRPGEMAPRVHTPTLEDVGGDAERIDTRVPPDQMHRDDLAEVLGERPVVLLFATPQFCESRVCGPVVDVAEQVREESGENVAFIHMEVYRDNDPAKGLRPQLRAFGLPTEPWLFVIDREGRIDSRFEGPFGAEELRRAVERVTAGPGGPAG